MTSGHHSNCPYGNKNKTYHRDTKHIATANTAVLKYFGSAKKTLAPMYMNTNVSDNCAINPNAPVVNARPPRLRLRLV